MKAVFVEQPGGVENLKYAEIPKPSPGPGQALVKLVHDGIAANGQPSNNPGDFCDLHIGDCIGAVPSDDGGPVLQWKQANPPAVER